MKIVINRYVPHANRALRSFNMFLNVRRPPLRSKFYWNPLSFFFPRPVEPSHSSSPLLTNHRLRSTSTTLPIPPIPPAANPRGELIFSSRIDKNFRESYERYRSAFERKREVKEYNERQKKWYGKLLFWERAPTPAPNMGSGAFTPTRVSSLKGSRSGTPPTPGSGGIVMKQRDRSRSPIRRGDNSLRERGGRRDRDAPFI
jgi:Spo7-like protein